MKSIFSFKLYKQGLKITKIPAIYAFISVICLNFAYVFRYSDKGNIYSIVLAPYSFVAYFFAAYLVYAIFSYTKSRSASDLFESFPKKRICLLFTFGASVATWISAVIISSNVINAISFNLFTKYTPTLTTSIQSISVQILFAFFVITASLCAVSISGSIISFVLSSISIMLISSAVYILILAILSDDLPFINQSYLFLKPTYTSRNFSFIVQSIYSFFPNIFEFKAQSFIMPLILFSLSFVLFSKRKSYNAGNGENKNLLAIIVSTVFSPVICLIIVRLFQDSISNAFSESSIFPLVASGFFVICTIMLKSIKKALMFLPFSLVSVLLVYVYVLFQLESLFRF